MPTNDPNEPKSYAPPAGDTVNYPTPGEDSAKAGYEMTDVNASGVVVFIGGLFGFVIIFFFFCFLMGRVINSGLAQMDGPTDKWHQQNNIFQGAKANNGNREDLKSNAAIQQQELQQMTTAFPGPRLQTDDGNSDTADLHAREDLLLDHYSSVSGQPLRIPITRAMELIAEKGLPVSTTVSTSTVKLAQSERPVVTTPLTNGFARRQRLEYGKAESSAEHAELKPVK
jgi:hypothetical protein